MLSLTFGVAALCVLLLGQCLGVGPAVTGSASAVAAAVAAVMTAAAVTVAATEPRARTTFGLALGLLVVAVALATSVSGFRFVFAAGSAWLTLLQVVLATTALALLAPGLGGTFGGADAYAQSSSTPQVAEEPPAGGGLAPEARALLWAVTGVVASVLGYNVGATQGNGPAGLVLGMVLSATAWAIVAVVRRLLRS